MTSLEIVKSFYDALGRGDASAALGLLDDSMQWTEAEGFPYSSGTWVGPQAVLKNLLAPLGRDWLNFSATPDAYTVEGSVVVAFGTYTGTFKRTGAAVRAAFAHRWEVVGGKATNFQQYTDTALFRKSTG